MEPLHELTADYRHILTLIENADGDVTEALSAALAAVAEPWQQKVKNRVTMLQTVDGLIDIIKREVTRLTRRWHTLAAHADWLGTDTMTQMLAVGERKLKTDLFTISVRPSPPSVNVLDADAVPEEWTHTDRIIERLKILAHFKETGEVVPGVEIVTDRKTLHIR